MNDNVKKVFDMLGVEPNEKFKVKFKNEVDNEFYYYFSEDLVLWRDDNAPANDYLPKLITGIWEIVKLQPKKKKLRDLTMDEYVKWRNKNCYILQCNECIFEPVHCTKSTNECWIKHKELYSDKFLDQEVEVPE